MDVPITQSKEWQKLQDDLGETSFFEQGTDYQYLAILKKTPTGNYLYLPYGPVFKDKTGFKHALASIQNVAKQNNAIFIRIEPQDSKASSYLPENSAKTKDLDPKDTWVLDLTQEQTAIISNFSQGTRTRYNTYAKKGLVVESTEDTKEIKHLIALQNKLFRAKKLNAFSEKYLKTELEQPFATLYLVKYQPEESAKDDNLPATGQVLAASLFFDYQDTRYYMQSAADGDYKRLPATVALLTTAIFDAKAKGLKKFDFWGIAPEGASRSHPWYGFTEFKKSFGGAAVHYAGTYDIVLNPFKYQIYKLFRAINRLLH